MSCCPPGSFGYLQADHKDEGRVVEQGGVKCYESGAMGEKAVLFLPDVWGWNSGRLRAIMDEFSKKHGVLCVVPKVLSSFEGGTDDDGLPPVFEISERMGDLVKQITGPWAQKLVVPELKKVVAAYADKGVKEVALIGFCYGAWVGFHLSAEELPVKLVCGATPHPSAHIEGMVPDGDVAGMASKIGCPWLLIPCGEAGVEGSDPAMYDSPDGAVWKGLEARFPGKNKTTRFTEQKHGFVTRGDIKTGTNIGSGDAVQKAVTKAVDTIVAYYKEHGFF